MEVLDEAALEERLKRGVNALFDNQPNIFCFTSETGQTEWNLAHHLANEIQQDEVLSKFDHDLEVTKHTLDQKRPDIIFHKRGTNCRNFLVIEMKRDGSAQEVCADRRKIEEYWFGDNLHYQFGAVINIKTNKSYDICVLVNPRIHGAKRPRKSRRTRRN